MNKNVYFFDDRQQLIKIIDENNLTECIQEKEITPDKSELMNNTISVVCSFDDDIKDAAFLAVQDDESSFSMFKIHSDNDPGNKLSFTGVEFGPDELNSYIVKDIRPRNESVQSIAERLVSFTDGEWRVGKVNGRFSTVSTSFYYLSVRDALKQLQTVGCEILFKCTVTGQGITDKWIEIYDQIGEVSNQRFDYGDNALEVVRERNRSQVYTSLIGRGRGEEVGDGYGRRIEFSDVEWKISKGAPLDKPKGQNWLEIPEMTDLYGIPTKKGVMRKRERVEIFDDIEEPEKLLQATYEVLKEISRPLVQFRTSVLGRDAVGNYVTIHRYDKGYHYQTRIFKIKVDRLSGKVEADLGDKVVQSSPRQLSSMQTNIQTLDEKKMTFFQSTEIGKYQDDIMRGAGSNGGSVYWVNGQEAGVSQSREVYEVIYMDGPDIVSSKDFLIQNNIGISFKHCKKGEWRTVQDVHKGDSNTAWTMDGIFNADFIQAGTLRAIDIIGTNIYGSKIESQKDNYLVRLDGSKLLFLKEDEWGKNLGEKAEKDRKLTELAGIFPIFSKNELKGVSLTQMHGYDFSIATQMKDKSTQTTVFEIPAESSAENPLLNLLGKITVRGNLDVRGTLSINGEKVYPGSVGSAGGHEGFDGSYPAEVKTQSEKFAWIAWVTLRSLGYSKEAAAGILGNINGEAGPTMNPDIDQVSGPAYGAVQFDGSSYPIVGTPTNNGREYFQRLHNASGVGGDYRAMDIQMKVVDWATKNGQWIGKAPPTNIEGFKIMVDPEAAASIWERNFERPANTHPERQQYARYWYDKFKDLKPATDNSTWKNPLRNAYTVTQEWDQEGYGTPGQIHGGIDLASPTQPVYAARAGKVIQVVLNHAQGGNYVIVQHSGGYWTYYGHMSSVFVHEGQEVTTSTVIGPMGMTGLATGVHLHFEVWKGGQWQRINPRDVIKF